MIHYISEIEQILKKLQTMFPCERINDENRFVKVFLFNYNVL